MTDPTIVLPNLISDHPGVVGVFLIVLAVLIGYKLRKTLLTITLGAIMLFLFCIGIIELSMEV